MALPAREKRCVHQPSHIGISTHSFFPESWIGQRSPPQPCTSTLHLEEAQHTQPSSLPVIVEKSRRALCLVYHLLHCTSPCLLWSYVKRYARVIYTCYQLCPFGTSVEQFTSCRPRVLLTYEPGRSTFPQAGIGRILACSERNGCVRIEPFILSAILRFLFTNEPGMALQKHWPWVFWLLHVLATTRGTLAGSTNVIWVIQDTYEGHTFFESVVIPCLDAAGSQAIPSSVLLIFTRVRIPQSSTTSYSSCMLKSDHRALSGLVT